MQSPKKAKRQIASLLKRPQEDLLASESRELAGRLPQGLLGLRVYRPDELAALVPMPAHDAHKYSRGKVVVVGGSKHYPGAACLAAHASQRSGAGYTQVWCASQAQDLVRATSPSLVVRSWDELSRDDFEPTSTKRPFAYVLGCGMDAALDADPSDSAKKSKDLVFFVLKYAKAPVLIDGGALSVLTSEKGRHLLHKRFVNGLTTLISPHAGEAARLAAAFNLPSDDPCRLSCLLAWAYGVIAIVKGPETFISDGDTLTRVTEGTPALAKAGTGDVLAGIIGAFLAQGLAGVDAAVLATSIHAKAGRHAALRFTDIGVCAEDLIEALPQAFVDVIEEK